MADNVQITSGSGTDIATDDVAGVHYQYVKLVDGTLDSTDKIGGDSSNGLDVDVTRLPALVAGSANIGDVDILTVPAPLSTSGGGSESTALRVTIANNSTGVLSVDDNDSSLTIDGSVTASAGTNLNTSLLALESGGNLAGILGSAQLIDDVVIILGTDVYSEAVSKGLIISAVRRDADTTLVNTTNEFGPLQMDANGRLKVEVFSGETLPISLTSTAITGTVAVTQSGTWDEVGINDSGNSLTVDAPVGTPVNVQIGDGTRQVSVRDTGSSDSLNVAIVDASGNQITSFGGGTSYTEGDTDATINGSAMLMEGAGDTLVPVQGTVADGLLVNLGSNNDVIVSATNLDIRDLTSGSDSVAAVQSGMWNITNISGTVSLPTGASTLTEQQSQTTHLATIAGDTTDIETAVELIDDTVATLGTTTYTETTTKGLIIAAVRRDADTTLVDTTNETAPLQVDANGRLKVEAFSGETLPVSLTSTTITGTVAVTQSGTWDEVGIHDSGNSITVDGTVTANLAAGTNNIGDVDILTIAAGDNNIGNVDIVTMPNVTNGGTFVVQENGAALTSLQLIDDVVTTLGTDTYSEATSKGLNISAVRRDADTTLVNTTNEFGPLQMDANGRLKVEAFSGETLPVSLTSTTITGTVAVTQSGTWDEIGINDSGNSITVDGTITANLAAGTNNIGDVDVLSVPAPLNVTGTGTESTALRVTIASDSTGVLSVDDNGSSLTVDGTVTANAGTGTFVTKETRSTAPTQSSVAGSASNATILASNANRLGATIYNDSTAILYLKLGATASATSFTIKMQAESYYEVPFNYTGIIDGIWSGATGNARITEIV